MEPNPGKPVTAASEPDNISVELSARRTGMSFQRTRMSADRTLMSVIRTSLSLIGFGFTIYQFFEKFQEATGGRAAGRPDAPRNLGLALMVAGTLGTLVSIWQYWQIVTYLSGDQYKAFGIREGLPQWSLTLALSALLALIGIVATAWVFLRS